MVAIFASLVAGPAGESMAAASQAHRFGIASVLPRAGTVVGVAHPVVVTFSTPIDDRRAAERAIGIRSTPAMTGKFQWLGNDVVQWVPDDFWPAHSTVALSVGGRRMTLTTGPKVIGVASIADHTFTVTIDGVIVSGGLVVSGGSGDDVVTISGASIFGGNVNIETNSGDDVVDGSGDTIIGKNLIVNTGTDDDMVSGFLSTAGTTSISMTSTSGT